jgi:ABC-type transport system involved in multi-copper enzyme maturation permease subunit
MKPRTLSLLRIRLIAGNTLLEAARQKLFSFLVVLAVALVVGAQWFRDFNFGAPELKFLSDFGFGAMAFFGAALTIAATAQLFFSEIENRTVLTLLAKPVGRADFVIGKFLGVAVVVGIFCALLTVLLAAVLWSREAALMRELPEAFAAGRVLHYGAIATAGLLQFSKLAVLAAFTLLIASYAQSQLYTVIMGFFVLVICHLQYLAQEAYGHAGSFAAAVIGGLIGLLFPNFQLFNLADDVGAGGVLAWDRVARVELYALGYVVAACALAIYSFRKREI